MIRRPLYVLIFALALAVGISAQSEPEFIGEAFVLNEDGSNAFLDKEIGDFTSGWSWSHNSNKAFWLELKGPGAKSRFAADAPLQFVVRAVDNNSDPMTIITIYKFKAAKKKRSVFLAKDNSGTLMKSKTNSKAMMSFIGKKYGTSSYLIAPNDLEPGEYGIVVLNPNALDQKRVVVSCFGID